MRLGIDTDKGKCALVDKIDYLKTKEILNTQREVGILLSHCADLIVYE